MGWTALLGCPLLMIVAGLAQEFIGKFKRSRLLATPVATAIERYEKALATYWAEEPQRREAKRRAEQAEKARREVEIARRTKLVEHWMSLGGLEFEHEMAALCRRLGYTVQSTPTSGDQGIDLILRKDGRTTIVQCKSYQAPTGPAIVREIFGAMVAFGAANAIVACTGGFTRGAKKFARGKPIILLSARELVQLAEDIDGKTIYTVNSPPTRPTHPACPDCLKTMVLRKGSRGEFWSCPNYPRCYGTREVTRF